MDELVKINNQDLQVKEFNGQRVVTFKDIDILHERVEGTAKRNFNENRGRFIEGVDYLIITKSQNDEFRTLEIPNRGLTLITESGYLILVKSLTDDLAWKVQRELVNSYFKGQRKTGTYSSEVRTQQKLFNAMKVEIASSVDEMVQVKINEIEEKCSQYYRPVSKEKANITCYIKKRLGIDKADEEYELVKQRVLIKLGGTKWEDIDVETLRTSLNVIDESIKIIKADRQDNQISLWD